MRDRKWTKYETFDTGGEAGDRGQGDRGPLHGPLLQTQGGRNLRLPAVRRAVVPFVGQVRRGVRLAEFRRRDSRSRETDRRCRRAAHGDHLRPVRRSSGPCFHRRGFYAPEHAPLCQLRVAGVRARGEKGADRDGDLRRRLFLGRGASAFEGAGGVRCRVGIHRRTYGESHLRGGVQPPHGTCRGGAGDVRSGESLLRKAGAALFRDSRPHAGRAAGTRHRRPVPFGGLLYDTGPARDG